MVYQNPPRSSTESKNWRLLLRRERNCWKRTRWQSKQSRSEGWCCCQGGGGGGAACRAGDRAGAPWRGRARWEEEEAGGEEGGEEEEEEGGEQVWVEEWEEAREAKWGGGLEWGGVVPSARWSTRGGGGKSPSWQWARGCAGTQPNISSAAHSKSGRSLLSSGGKINCEISNTDGECKDSNSDVFDTQWLNWLLWMPQLFYNAHNGNATFGRRCFSLFDLHNSEIYIFCS